MADTTKEITVGIDLGTTNYSAVIFQNGGLQVLKNAEGVMRIPCFVFFSSKSKLYVGAYAKVLENRVQKRYGLYDTKRFLGREYNDEEVQALIPRFEYNIEEHFNKPIFVLERQDGKVYKTPVQICTLFLTKIKKNIEDKIGKVDQFKVVLTVPANYNVRQKEDILTAAKNADLQVLELLPEPTAIALRYFSLYRKFEEGDTFLVYNLGGSSFNVAVLQITDNNLSTVAVSDDTKLSGLDFDQIIFNYLLDKLNDVYDLQNQPNKDLKPLIRRLQIKSEEIKIQLSAAPRACIWYKSTSSCIRECRMVVTRRKFENLAQSLLQKTVDLVDQCLQKNNLSKSQVKKVILYGGLAKMPKIQELLMEYFGKTLTKIFVYVNSSVAEGAALHAGMLATKQCVSPNFFLNIFDNNKFIDLCN